MIFNIPYTYFGFFFEEGLATYLISDGILVLSYEIIWIVCWKKFKKFKAYSLSIIPSIIFILSGILLVNVPLIVVAAVFAASHITISVKSVK